MESCDDIFLNARELTDPAERAAYLDQACGNDAQLRQRVEVMLLDAEGAGKFFDAVKTVVMTAPVVSTISPSAVVRYFGDYELQEEIGRGGMGVVYKARQVTLNRIVAVKMIISGEYAGPEERRRFQREAEASAQLRHPHIVAIHEVGEHEGRSYFSMDFIEGQTLSAQLKEGKMPPARAAALVKTLAEAVHFAHQRGTLHRDLKPQNILISPDGQPHILDFGLARPVEREAGLTQTGEVMGTPSYMPPEQATGRIGDIGPASDVYGLGAILYEAITGKPPFTDATAMEVLSQVINQDPVPLRKHSPNVPADLETICLKCLEKRPERRYHSARALAEELERFLNFEPILARPASRLRKSWNWSQRNPWVFAAGFGLVALALVCVAYGLWEKTRVLNWRLAAGNAAVLPSRDAFFGLDTSFLPQQPTRQAEANRAESPALLFFLGAPALFSLLYFFGRMFRRRYRRQVESGAAIPAWPLLCHAAAGTAGATIGLAYLLLQIRAWMWQTSSAQPLVKFAILGVEILAVFCALALSWVGIRMVWEAAGIHETSRYRGLVNKALDQQWAGEGRRRLVFKWIGLIWWLYALMLAVIFILKGTNAEAGKRDLIAAGLGMLLSTGVTVLAVWAIRNRRRLFTFVCVPLTLAGYGFAFVALTANNDVVAILLLLYLLGIVQALVIAPLFLNQKPSATGQRTPFPVKPWLDIVFGLVFVVGLFGLLHLVEDWRGRAVWAQSKSALEAKGAKLDWAAYIPAPIPDDQNIFKAPHMREWFTREKSDQSFNSGPLGDLLAASAPWSGGNAAMHFLPLAEITILPLKTHPMFAPGEADLILRLTGQLLTVVPQNYSPSPASHVIDSNGEVVDVAFDSAPLHDVINALALQAKLNIIYDPAIFDMLNTFVTAKWRHISIIQAFSTLLDNNGLRSVDGPVPSIKRIVRKDWRGSVPSINPMVGTNGEVVDTVAFDSVPLRDVINALALQAKLEFQFDPAILEAVKVNITAKWRHVSATQALWAVLDNYGLSLRNTPPGSKIWRVVAKDPNEQAIDTAGEGRAALKKIMDQTLGPSMIDPQGNLVPQRPLDQTRAARIILLCDRAPTTNEMEALFRDCLNKIGYYYNTVQVEATASDSMSVTANCLGSAGDYVTWSEKCEPQLELIRQALRRPSMRLDIDYSRPLYQLVQNWVAGRILCQMLGATAQAYMLRGDPDHALRQLTLMHDLRRIMLGPPNGQPEDLVSAMINTAVTGLYVSTIQCGLQAHAWLDPQLAALEQQLAEIDLPACVERSFRLEQTALPQMMDFTPRAEMADLALRQWNYLGTLPKTMEWEHFRLNIFSRLAPRGWLDQNKAAMTEAFQPAIDAFSPAPHALQPWVVDDWGNKLDNSNPGFSPYTVFRTLALHSFGRALRITCQNQTSANQARIACALERYRLAHNEYPEALEPLVPQFLDHISRDLIGGQTPVYHRDTNGGIELSSAGWNDNERWNWPPQ